MKSLKVNRIEKENLSEKEMNQVRGGNTCGCGCLYADKGGSSTYDNANANLADNKFSGSDHDRIITIEVGPIKVN
jgi:natural product precursor